MSDGGGGLRCDAIVMSDGGDAIVMSDGGGGWHWRYYNLWDWRMGWPVGWPANLLGGRGHPWPPPGGAIATEPETRLREAYRTGLELYSRTTDPLESTTATEQVTAWLRPTGYCFPSVRDPMVVRTPVWLLCVCVCVCVGGGGGGHECLNRWTQWTGKSVGLRLHIQIYWQDNIFFYGIQISRVGL